MGEARTEMTTRSSLTAVVNSPQRRGKRAFFACLFPVRCPSAPRLNPKKGSFTQPNWTVFVFNYNGHSSCKSNYPCALLYNKCKLIKCSKPKLWLFIGSERHKITFVLFLCFIYLPAQQGKDGDAECVFPFKQGD